MYVAGFFKMKSLIFIFKDVREKTLALEAITVNPFPFAILVEALVPEHFSHINLILFDFLAKVFEVTHLLKFFKILRELKDTNVFLFEHSYFIFIFLIYSTLVT